MRSRGYRRVVLVSACCWGLVGVAGCGALGPPLVSFDDNVNGEVTCLDIWSLLHAGSGGFLGSEYGDQGLVATTAILTGYEWAEPRFWPGWNESELNQTCDVLVGLLAWLAESRSR